MGAYYYAEYDLRKKAEAIADHYEDPRMDITEHVESFRAECLNASWFLSLADARSKCESWRADYNEVRPHSSIGQKTLVELAKSSGQPWLS